MTRQIRVLDLSEARKIVGVTAVMKLVILAVIARQR